MGIETAIIGSAVLGAGASALSSSSAAKKAAKASQTASDTNAQLQREALATQQSNTATARAGGDLAINQLLQRMGLTAPGTTVGQGAQGAPTGQAGSAGAGQAPYRPPQAGSPDWNAVLADRPDVAAAVNDPNGGYNGATPQERASDWYSRYGQQSGYQAPTVSAEQATAAAPKTDVQLSPSAQVPTYQRPADTGQAPTYTPQQQQAQTYTPQNYQRPTYDKTLDVSLDSFKNSPEYQAAEYDIGKQSGATASALAATGGLQSGAALKRLQEIGQDNKIKYYGDYRDYTTGQYNTDRNRADQNYNYDTSLASNNALAHNQLNSNNALAYAQLNNQNNQFGANYNQNAYQYGQSRADNNFNLDRAYGTDLALNNRAYETGRWDTATGNLFNLANLGQGAAAQYGNAVQNSANNQGNALFSNAANQGNAALTQANALNGVIGQGINALGYYYGNQGGAAKTTGGAYSNPYASQGLFT